MSTVCPVLPPGYALPSRALTKLVFPVEYWPIIRILVGSWNGCVDLVVVAVHVLVVLVVMEVVVVMVVVVDVQR